MLKNVHSAVVRGMPRRLQTKGDKRAVAAASSGPVRPQPEHNAIPHNSMQTPHLPSVQWLCNSVNLLIPLAFKKTRKLAKSQTPLEKYVECL